jgi:hypothetical protein
MEIDPATSAATPAIKIGPLSTVAPATPMTIPAVETMPSFAPSTPARNQLSLLANALRSSARESKDVVIVFVLVGWISGYRLPSRLLVAG